LKRYGPVPTGSSLKLSGKARAWGGETIASSVAASLCRNRREVSFRVMRKVSGSTGVMPSMRLASKGARSDTRSCGFRKRFSESVAASALSSVPSWNSTSWRSSKVELLPSADWLNLRARPGPMLPSCCTRTSVSAIWSTMLEVVGLVWPAGSSVSGSTSSASRRPGVTTASVGTGVGAGGSGVGVLRPDLTIATMDHNTPTWPLSQPVTDTIAKAQLDALERNCKEFGVRLEDRFSPLQGIVHVIGPELGLTQPGLTIVCGDSHTSTHGAFGALA